jgi:ketosteroid isomerase-like protein
LSILVLPPALASDEAPLPGRRASLDAYRSAHVQAVLHEDIEPIVSPYVEDARLIPPYHGTVFGPANVRSYYSAFFERFDVREYRRDELKTFNLGSRLIVIGRYALSLAAVGGAQVHEITGSYMDIWESVPGKPLGLMTHAWNTDAYSPVANDLRFSDVPSVRTAFEAHVPVSGGLSFELAALNRLHEVAILQHDDKVWSQFFAEDAVLLANQHGLLQGRPAIDAYLADHVKEMPVFEKLDIRNDEIDATGRYVIEYASHVANWRNGDSSGVNTGKNIRLWRREREGTLKMICGIGTYD